MSALKVFFYFFFWLIAVEIVMKNHLEFYESKSVVMKDVLTLTKEEFQIIIDWLVMLIHSLYGGKEKEKHVQPYLVHGFKLFYQQR
jgi:hypothetical protein